MAEYYGNRPSRDYFTLISALDATFSPEKVGSGKRSDLLGENPDLFTLSKGFQQEERFPSQPEYGAHGNILLSIDDEPMMGP